MSSDDDVITEEKLRRKDYFRPQVHLESREDRILWGAEYNFTADEYPEIAQGIRDFAAVIIMKKLKETFRTMKLSNPAMEGKFRMWIMRRITDQNIVRELDAILGRTDDELSNYF